MVAFCTSACASRQICSAALWLGVWERNARALAFYRKWGFDVVGEHTFKLGEDPQHDLIMRRDLQSTEGDSGQTLSRSDGVSLPEPLD